LKNGKLIIVEWLEEVGVGNIGEMGTYCLFFEVESRAIARYGSTVGISVG